MKPFYVLFLIIAVYFKCSAQTWEKHIPGTGYVWLKAVTSTSDGGCIFSGATTEVTGKRQDCFLLKCTKEREVEWFKTYGTLVDEGFDHIIQTLDGGYAILGRGVSTYQYYGPDSTSYSTFSKGIFVRTNAMGDILWSVVLPNYCTSIVQLPDSTFILAGGTEFPTRIPVLYNIDKQGTIKWTKSFKKPLNTTFVDMVITKDNKLMMLTRSDSEVAGIIKTDHTGNILWSKTFGGTCFYLLATKDNGAIFSGGTIVKIDSLGNVQWAYDYKSTHIPDQIIIETKDGGYLCSQTIRIPTDLVQYFPILFKIDSAGSIQWSHLLGTNNIFNLSENDSGYYLEGNYRVGSYLAKTDHKGLTGCEIQKDYPLQRRAMNYTPSDELAITENILEKDSMIVLPQKIRIAPPFENTCCFYKPSIEGGGSACDRQETTLFAIGASHFTWSTGDTTQTITVMLNGKSTFWVESRNTCKTDRDTAEIIPHATPTFTVSVKGKYHCWSDSITLIINGDADSYGSNTGRLEKIKDSVYYYKADSANVIIILGRMEYTDMGDCVTADTTFIQLKRLNPVITQKGKVLFSNYSGGNQWYLNGNILPGENNDSIHPQIAGKYKVLVTDSSCKEFSNEINYQLLSVSTDLSHTSLNIFPNPFKDEIYVSGNFSKDVTIKVFDIIGKELIRFNNITIENGKRINLNLEFLKNGIYFLDFEQKDINKVIKIIKVE